jgi:hypothetical protein
MKGRLIGGLYSHQIVHFFPLIAGLNFRDHFVGAALSDPGLFHILGNDRIEALFFDLV